MSSGVVGVGVGVDVNVEVVRASGGARRWRRAVAVGAGDALGRAGVGVGAGRVRQVVCGGVVRTQAAGGALFVVALHWTMDVQLSWQSKVPNRNAKQALLGTGTPRKAASPLAYFLRSSGSTASVRVRAWGQTNWDWSVVSGQW